MKRLFLLAAAIVVMATQVLAASGVINCRGRVVDEQGQPVIGATIQVPGTSVGTATDIDGQFSIKVSKGETIVITSIGYKPLKLKSAAQLGEIGLEIESTMLNDVVVTQSVAKTRETPVALSEVSAEVITAESFAQQRAERQVVIFGNGAAKCRELMTDATFINITPSARGLARLAQERFDAGQTEDIAYFEPFYLKDFVVIPSKKKLL